MKIAYLHGLESTIDQKDPKIIFLNKNFDSVYAPSINYQDDKTFNKLYKSIKSLNPDLIVGSSMGGYVSYLIGSKLSIPVLLFNPAMVGRTFDPVVDDSGLKKTKINIRFGKSDSVINGSAVRSFFKENGISFNHIVYNGGHRVPTDVFIDSIKGVLGMDEMYDKIEKIQHSMKHIKLFEQFTSEAKKVRDGGHDKGLKESVLNEEDTYNDYPSAAKANAQKAIDWKEKYGRDEVEAGTAVGWARAHQLAKGENLSADTVGRMSSFNRHRKNATISPDLKDTPWLDKGYVSWLIWGGDEGVDWAMATMDKIKKEESVMLPRYEEFVNEKKKSKPKSDNQKIKDLTKKQKSLSDKSKDIMGQIQKLSKDDEKDPTDKLQSALLKTQMQQTSVDGMKVSVQKQQIALKSKLKTVKKRSKAGKK